MSFQATTSQTVGPYFSIGLSPLYRSEIAGPQTAGQRIHISGRVLDGEGDPLPDAVLEAWQADADGRYRHPEDRGDVLHDDAFTGFGRIATDANGGFAFNTIKPGRAAGNGGSLQAPHILVSVFMRGVLKRVVTRIYFEDETIANDEDLVLSLVPSARRTTLIAKRDGEGSYRWDVHMQGPHETVFFSF